MTQTCHRNILSPVANKSARCIKVKCHRSLPTHHPISYTNGFCERHFFEIDLPSNDDDDDETNKSKLSSKKKSLHSIKHRYQPMRDDIRKTREIFDGRQWRVIQQKIAHGPTAMNDPCLLTTENNNNNEGHLLQIFRLLSSCQMIQDELKKQEQQN